MTRHVIADTDWPARCDPSLPRLVNLPRTADGAVKVPLVWFDAARRDPEAAEELLSWMAQQSRLLIGRWGDPVTSEQDRADAAAVAALALEGGS